MEESFVRLRREELIAKLANHYDQDHHKNHDEDVFRRRFDLAFDRLIAIETLEAQARLARSQEQLATAQHEVAEAQAAETKRLEQVRSLSDNQNFWFRRFLTSLTVAHGAGAFAALTAMMRTPPPVATPQQVENILWCFLTGLLFMGSLPIIYALVNPENPDPKRLKNTAPVAWLFAGLSTLLLACGILIVIQVALATYDQNDLANAQAKAAASQAKVLDSASVAD
jgi:heme/copper-type cytochrome/quinol oxidase subunit 3